MKEDDKQNNGHTLALAATLAMLGVSVGVNVPELLAAPDRPIESNQSKIGPSMKGDALRNKKEALQQKVPAVQNKDSVVPSPKPVDPLRK